MNIDSFDGEYSFLSNFYICPVWGYMSVEHAFQACKTLDESWRNNIRTAATPGMAKRLGRMAPIREGWEDMKLDTMLALVRYKFTEHQDLALRLIATGDAVLIEGNNWNDRYWGICRGVGLNHLGLILMQVRREIQT